MKQPESTPADQLQVPFDRVATFIRQVTHDVRNNLNAMDLQAAYVVELVADPEAVEEVRRIRSHIQQAAKQLQALSGNFWVAPPNLVTYSAKIFVEDLQDRLAKMHPDQAPKVKWTVQLDEKMVSLDLEMIFTGIAEVFENAFQFKEGDGALEAHVREEAGKFVIELLEPKTTVPSDPQRWGREPFLSSRRGAYGLGLYRARRIFAAHDGELSFSHDSGRNLLSSKIVLPFAANE